MSDRVVLTLPTAKRYRGVASLVLGGIGSRLDLPYERTDDLQLAVLSVLDASDGDEVTLDMQVEEDELSVVVGPLAVGSSTDQALARVLDLLVDTVESSQCDGSAWITLRLLRP